MCRLFGSLSYSKSKPDKQIFENIVSLSKNGGPDSTCFYHDDLVDLGFNRLAILDTTSSGNQPILSPSGRFIIMLNGEIYNYRELANTHNLHNLRSGSDAEVLAHLIELHDFDKILTLLNGMFAIIIWDTKLKLLYLGRDFAGIKPLFYSNSENGFLFSSHFNQILVHPWMRNWSWNEEGLAEYLQLGYMPSPYTVAQNVFSLEPGQSIMLDAKEHTVRKSTYSTLFKEQEKYIYPETSPNTIHQMHNILRNTVANQLEADVPIGIFLSGGIDSTLIAAIASKIRPDLTTVTIGFENRAHDESILAQKYAKRLGLQNKNLILSRSEVISLINEYNLSATEPLADTSSIPMYLASKLASQSFKVMLSGDGGDEVFWGYPRYLQLVNSRFLFQFKSYTLRKLISKLLLKSRFGAASKISATSLGQANLLHHSTYHTGIHNIFLNNKFLNKRITTEFEINTTKSKEILKYLQKNDFYFFLQKVLTKVDRASMTNGIEVRVPYLDLRVLEFAEKIKPELAIKHNTLKYISKTILCSYSLESATFLPKKGFTPPLSEWAIDILQSDIENTIEEARTITSLPINVQFIIEQWLRFKDNKRETIDFIWSFYSLVKWYKLIKN